MMYSFDEIGLLPAVTSTIKHRSDCNPFISHRLSTKLPIFISPMTCLLNETNIETVDKSLFIPIYPIAYNKKEQRDNYKGWVAYTLSEFQKEFCTGKKYTPKNHPFARILIDCANGHMQEIYDSVKLAKSIKGYNIQVMIGNIANPEAYIECCKVGVDYVRVGIGGGSGCITSCVTGVHASLPWLITEINTLKYKLGNKATTKVVADGGINSIDKIIKALALGADYVMIGKLFAECKESATDLYYGQASEQGQIDRFGKIKAYPEGTECKIETTTTIKELESSITKSLMSAMSYAGKSSIHDFIGKVRWEPMTITEFNAYNK